MLSRALRLIFDESEGSNKPETVHTVFLSAVVKPQEATVAYNHYSVLRMIDDNFLSCPLIAVTAWAGNQILAKPLHLYGCFLYLLSIFVALPR